MVDNNLHRLKVQLKLAVNRLRLLQQKKDAIAKQQRRELATLVETGRVEFARIRCEHVIQEDINVEMLSMIELYCELLLARFGLLDSRECDPGLEEGVKTIIYAAPRCEAREVLAVRDLLIARFGKEFGLDAIENRDGKVNAKVLAKLRVEPPRPELVESYLYEITRAYGVPYGDDESSKDDSKDDDDNDDNTGGQTEPRIQLPEPPAANPDEAFVTIAPASPSSENPAPSVHLPSDTKARPRGSSTSKPKGNVPSFDELTARFNALKRT